jgi:glyoxylase-like metal-dependent hydrolase (beta-lactamase superfamily II)
VPVLIDCGHHSSPADAIAPALAEHGVPIGSIRLVLATHGHYDHIGGAASLMAMLPADAAFAIHEADVLYLRSVAHHRSTYSGFAHRWLGDTAGEAELDRTLASNLVPADFRVANLRDVYELGGGASLHVVHSPGHTSGSTTFRLEPWGVVFTGDAVQVHGGSGQKFPLITDPAAYRRSLRAIAASRPAELFMGHRTLAEDRSTVNEQRQRGHDVAAILEMSERIEARIASAAESVPDDGDADDLAWLERAAVELGYPGGPAAWPTSFAPTLLSYRATGSAR